MTFVLCLTTCFFSLILNYFNYDNLRGVNHLIKVLNNRKNTQVLVAECFSLIIKQSHIK